MQRVHRPVIPCAVVTEQRLELQTNSKTAPLTVSPKDDGSLFHTFSKLSIGPGASNATRDHPDDSPLPPTHKTRQMSDKRSYVSLGPHVSIK